MSGGGKFVALLGWLFGIALGIWLVMAVFDQPPWAREIPLAILDTARYGYGRWLLAAGGALLALFVFALPFLGARRKTREKLIEFTGEVGVMVIEVGALEDCLRRAVLEDEDVTYATVRIDVPELGREDPIVCTVDIGIKERPNVPGKANELAKRTQKRFLEILPMDTPPKVDMRKIHFTRPKPLVSSHFPAAPAPFQERRTEPLEPVKADEKEPPKEEAADLPVGPFTGEMKYPLEEEAEETKEKK